MYKDYNDRVLMDMLTMEVVHDIIYGDFSRIKLIKSADLKDIDRKVKNNCHVVLLVAVDHFWEICADKDNRERYLIKRKALNCIRNSLESKYTFAATSLVGTDKLVVLMDLSSFNDKAAPMIKVAAHEIQEYVKNKTNLTVTISASTIYSRISELWKGYEEAFQLMKKAFFYEENFIITADNFNKISFTDDAFEIIEYRLFESLAKGDQDQTIMTFKNFCQWASTTCGAVGDANIIKSRVTRLYFKIANYCTEVGVNTATANELLINAVAEIIGLNKIVQVERSGIAFITQLQKVMDTVIKNDLRLRLDKVIAFVKKYYNRDLGVAEMADMANMSTSYFCRKFREFYGVTFVTYHTNLRLEAAKELLENSTLSVSQISSSVGFNDMSYLSRSFKIKFGVAPSYYRQKVTE